MAPISLRGVAKAFGDVRAVQDLDLEIGDGELFVLVGASGSGKSTVLRLVAGLERPDAGAVLVGGRDVTGEDPGARDVGMVFQSYALFPHRTVAENISFGLRARRERRVEERVREIAATLGLDALLGRLPAQLSGGERQRVGLARALVRAPAVLLLDEPLSNLDAQLRAQSRTEIARLQRGLGTTTIHVTHDQAEALSLGDRIGVLHEGRLEQVGTPDDVYERPASLVVARFIGTPAMNVLRRDGEVLGVRPEHVHVAGSRWAGSPPAETLAATVELVEPVGDQTHLSLTTAEGPLVARVEPSLRPAPGTRLDVWLDHVHRFDAATGRRIGP
jgi:ABC-type sugar transport system ATPase subunit